MSVLYVEIGVVSYHVFLATLFYLYISSAPTLSFWMLLKSISRVDADCREGGEYAVSVELNIWRSAAE